MQLDGYATHSIETATYNENLTDRRFYEIMKLGEHHAN